MKLNKILFGSVLLLSQALIAYGPENQNTIRQSTPLELEEKTLNTRFTLTPSMMNSNNNELGFAVDFAINENLMVGPDLSYHKYSARFNDVGAYGLGINMTYSLTENFDDGWFINPAAKIYSYEAKSKTSQAYLGEAPKGVVNLSLMYGYKWIFNDGFNIRLAAGLQYNSDNSFYEEASDGWTNDYNNVSLRGGSGLSLDSDLSVGLIF